MENIFEVKDKVKYLIEKFGGEINRATLMQYGNWTKQERDEICKELVKIGFIKEFKIKETTRPRTYYILAEEK